MQIRADQSVKELAATIPNAARIFEIFGIDVCCRGDLPLAEASAHAGLALDEAMALLSGDWRFVRPPEGALRWTMVPLADLIEETVQGHHRYARSRLAWFDHALRQLGSGHARTQAQLVKLRSTLDRLIEVLVPHMRYEEQVVFPYMRCLERVIDPDCHPASGGGPQDSLRLQAMADDHSSDLALIDEMRRATSDYTPIAGACENERALYRQLAEFDSDLRLHIQLENDVLFRRAAEMEAIAQSQA